VPAWSPSSALLADLESRLDSATLTAVRQELDIFLHEVLHFLDEETHPAQKIKELPPYPVEPLLERLHTAIAQGESVEIEYYTAGRGIFTRRLIEPLRLEQERGIHYLVAYCYWRQGERIFRVDRIRALREENVARKA